MPLTAPASRGALFRRGAQGLPRMLAICAAASLVLLGIVLALDAWLASDDRAETMAKGRVETLATVTEADSYWDENEVGEAIIVSDIVFAYETEAGERLTGAAKMRGYDRDWRAGHTLPVWYAEADPAIYEVGAGHLERNESALGILLWIFGGFLMLLPVALALAAVWSPWSRAGRLAAIRDTGQAEQARVLALTREDIKHGREGHLRWQVKGLPPATSAFPVPESERPATGATITIYRKGEDQVWPGEVGPPARA